MIKKGKDKYIDTPIHKLKPHPRNEKMYRKRTQQEIDDLACDMERNGQLEPVEVTDDGTIISGHGRWEAAKKLGWETVRCWVRSDLKTPNAVMTRLVEANLYRRQLSRLDLVRSYQQLKMLEKDRSAEKVKGDLRDLIASRFTPPVSGRTLDRWLQVLKMRMEIQEAVDNGSMKLTDALKVAALEDKAQAQVAREIGEGKPIKEIFAGHLYKIPAEALTAGEAVERLLKGLKRAQEELRERVEDVALIDFRNELDQLREGRTLIKALIARIKLNKEEAAAKSRR